MESLYEDEDETEELHRARGSLQKLLSKLRKALIVAFSSNSKQSDAYRTHIALSLCLTCIATAQGMSLILTRTDTMAEYTDMEKVFALVNYARVDTLAVDLGIEYSFFYVLLTVIWAPVGILVVNLGTFLYWKKKPYWLLVTLMHLLLTGIEQVLLLPALVSMISFIKYTYFSSPATMFEYGYKPQTHQSAILAAISLITLPLLVVLLYLNSYFFYDNVYSKRRKFVYSMRDSFAHRMDLLMHVGMVVCYSVLSDFSSIWYRLGVLFLSGIMLSVYSLRLPYFNTIVNVEYASRMALIAWSAVAYIIGWATNSATTIVILILFISPMIVLLLHYKVIDSLRVLSKKRTEDIAIDYQVELKLRSLLEAWENKADQEATGRSIEQLFDFATRNFPKSPLLPFWEASFYHYYKRNTSLALLKLSKLHTTDTTLEALFFASKHETKLSSLEISPERLYFRFLKLLNDAKRMDESCCLQLVAACSELLSKKVDAGKFESMVGKLSAEMSKTLEKYFRLLELYPENEEILQLLGSFMCEIVKETEGKNFLTKRRMAKSSEARRASANSLLSDTNGLVVLSCCIDHQGEIVLANQKVYEMFKYSKIDLHKKPICCFMPEKYRHIYVHTMNSVVLYGHWLDSFPHLFSFLIDYEGYLMPAKVTTKLTTWDNKPHIILTIVKLLDTDWVLVDQDWKVTAHSCLDPEASTHLTYEGCEIEEVLPGFNQHIDQGEQSFDYCMQGYLRSVVTIREVTFRDVFFRLISMKRAINADRSPISVGLGYFPSADLKEAAKGVRFHSEDRLFSSINVKPESMQIYDTPAKLMHSEAQTRVNKKLDLTTSLSISTSAGAAIEALEGAKLGRSLKRVKLLLMLSFLMLVTGLIASVIFVTSILSSLDSITTISNYSERSLQLVKIAYDTRSLILSDSPLYPYDRPSTLSSLAASAQRLEKLIIYTKTHIGEESVEDYALLQPSTPMWIKMQDKYEFHMLTFLDALYAYTAAAARLSGMEPPYTGGADAYFLFNNGVGDLPLIANWTLGHRVDNENDSHANSLSIIKYLVYMCISLVLLPLVLLVAPQFYQFEQRSKAIWTSIYTLPIDCILEVRTAAIDRLQSYFSNEYILDTSTSAKSTERRIAATRLWPGFSLRLCAYLALSLVFFVVIEMVYFLPLSDLALTIPHYLYWMSMRATYIYEGMLWARERALLQSSSTAYAAMFPIGQHWATPQERIKTATASVMYINKLLYFGSEQANIYSVKKSHEYLDFIMKGCCEEVAVEACEDKAAALGFMYMAREWNLMIRAVHPSADQVFEQVRKEEKATETAELGMEYAVDYYHKDSIAQIHAISVQIITLAVCYIGAVFALYVGLYARHLTALLVKARQALRVYKLLSRGKVC